LTTFATPSTQLGTIPKTRVPVWSYFSVLLLTVIVYLGSAFSPALQDDADSTHAEAAREMLATGDYVTLHVNGVRYLEKAPLMYWLLAFSYRMFGINEFAARFPTVVAVFLLVLLAMRWSARGFGDPAQIYSGLLIATSVGTYLFTRILIPEAILSLLIASTFYFFVLALQESCDVWRWYAGYACLALAVLTKGLIALVIVGITSILYLAITGEWRRWREFRLGTGLLLFFLIAAPWHLIAGFRNPRFFWFYFVNEHFLRFLGKRYPSDYNKVPALLYWELHLVWLFPWSAYLPLVVRNMRRDFGAISGAATLGSRTRLLCWIWAGVVLTFFAFSTSQEYYTFPAYFPLLLLLASTLAEEEESGGRSWLVSSSALAAAVSGAAGLLLVAGLWSSRHLPFQPDISAVLASHNMSNDTLSMSHMLDLTGNSLAALRLPALLAATALVVGPTLTLWLRIRRKQFAGTWATALTMALFLIAAHMALGRFDTYLSSKKLALQIAARSGPSDKVAIYGDQAFGSSLLFYLRRPVYLVNGRTTSMWFGSTYPDAPKIYWNDTELLQKWNSEDRVFLFVPPHEKVQVDSLLPDRKYVVAESSGKIIYSNHR
jgi:4-amino-4-deoxy-L-arabinose transferase-like glycosyltransferase